MYKEDRENRAQIEYTTRMNSFKVSHPVPTSIGEYGTLWENLKMYFFKTSIVF